MIRGTAKSQPPLRPREGPAFSGWRQLLEWHFATQRIRAIDPEAGGDHADSDGIALRTARLTFTSKVVAAVPEGEPRMLLQHLFADGWSESRTADALGLSTSVIGRRVARLRRIVIDRAVELGLLEER